MNEHLTQRIIDALRDALDCMAAKVNSPMVREDCYNVIAKIKESISEQPLQPAPRSFVEMYKDNAQGIEIERLTMRIEELEAAQSVQPATIGVVEGLALATYPFRPEPMLYKSVVLTAIAHPVQPPQNHVWLVANKVVAMYFWSEDRAKKAASGSITLGMDVLRINLLDASPVQPASEKKEHEPRIDLDRYAGTYGGTKDK